MSSPEVSVVVPALDAERTLPRALRALANQETSKRYEVIVVDDGSRDATFSIADGFEPPVRAVRTAGRTGAAATRNRGAAEARAPRLAFTDSDCFPRPDWLERGLAALAGADLIQGAVVPDQAARRGPFDRTLEVTEAKGYFETANLFVRRELFESLGGFAEIVVERGGDPPFGWRAPRDGRAAQPARTPIGEDVVFGWRARRAGARVEFEPDAVVEHAVVPGTPAEAVRRRWHLRHMPALAREVPELRRIAFHRSLFFNRRTAVFDLAACSLVAALVLRRPALVAGAAPYARWLAGEAAEWRRRGVPFSVGGRAAEDAATLVSLAVGSAAWRAPVL